MLAAEAQPGAEEREEEQWRLLLTRWRRNNHSDCCRIPSNRDDFCCDPWSGRRHLFYHGDLAETKPSTVIVVIALISTTLREAKRMCLS